VHHIEEGLHSHGSIALERKENKVALSKIRKVWKPEYILDVPLN